MSEVLIVEAIRCDTAKNELAIGFLFFYIKGVINLWGLFSEFIDIRPVSNKLKSADQEVSKGLFLRHVFNKIATQYFRIK